MKYIKTSNSYKSELITEKKWHWWLLSGLLISNSLVWNKLSNNDKDPRPNIERLFTSANKIDYIDIIKDAKEEVKDKVLSNPYIKNKREVLKAIDGIEIIETPKELGTNNPGYLNYDEDGLKLEYIVITKSILDQFNDRYKKMAIMHELFHLVDYHKLIQDKPNIKIDKITKDEWYDISGKILNLSEEEISNYKKKDILKGNYQVKFDYLTSNHEIYARLNNLKSFLFRIGKLKSPNDDITNKLWKDIYNGNLVKEMNDEILNDFYDHDFFLILPFIKSSNLDDINKLAYISIDELKNVA